MQTENNAPAVDTTTTAPAGAAPTSQTTTPPASGSGDAGQGQTDAGTTSATGAPAEGQADQQGKQQDASDGATEQADRDEGGRFQSKIQKRINELTHARHAAEREAARWRGIAEGRQAAAAPQAHEFASDADYEAALRQHEIKEGAREIASENARQAAAQYQQDAQQAVADTYNQRVQAAVARLPDFVDVVGKADIKISADMLQALQESEHGPDIVYQLAKNPEEAQRLANMSVRQLDREIGRMEAALAAKGIQAAPAAAAAPAARTTKAPAPASTGAPAGAAPANTDPAKMSMGEYEAWRKANGSKYIR